MKLTENRANDPLNLLSVIQRLEVGPVKVEPKRLIAPYKVIRNGGEDSLDLIYRYEETVFDPAEAESQNLAGVIAAQVALNYGLFCERIVFRGIFDESDQRFLHTMAENTAREIFVKKFLEPNPFLLGDAAKLPPVKRDCYLKAELVFPGSAPVKAAQKWKPWTNDARRYAISSSGGKDSLLSYGLLNELGMETHPVFGNESGRHWFTALNAYRHFKEHIPHTARVWMNSDRVFARMLRHLPFIRQDFANVRSDEYPIRLWTVAVFLFGVLPLMRKRGVGRLVIGDEFDTTRRINFQGIPHYDGLYDQSRYFDNALGRYYHRKGWNITQFSLIRPLSELLIEKILVERYPDLQAQQVSCHAAHKEGERIHPCGKCEKCRRIVGMLTAIGADPSRCGYTAGQIKNCLKELAEKSVHQESAGAEHLLWMLSEKGLIELSGQKKKSAKPKPHIMKLRFHPEMSPIDGIPMDLREPLYRRYLEHAGGALWRQGRNWIDFDPLTDPFINQPFTFEGG